ncbi:TonB family protein [Parvularcula sp. IMCC14364]|uniref:TonB family protein n=1 Tax=Parvularcula sp. IMCC14364 TaxID=3067902 RepID=UPI002740BD11|nr:TonB family protein [Parvularcula sp. IMCC14364]
MSSVADIVELQEERSKRAPLTDEEFQTAGAMLKAAREAAGYSLDDAHDATNVRIDYLEAIEEMDATRLPIAAYTTGFVKAYAQFLELPDEALVARFRKEAGYVGGASTAPELRSSAREDVTAGRELSLLAVVAILFFVIWVAFQITRPPVESGPIAVEGTPLQQRPVERVEEPTFTVANEAAGDAARAEAATETTELTSAAAQSDAATGADDTLAQPAVGDAIAAEDTVTGETETAAPTQILSTEAEQLADAINQVALDAADLNAQQLSEAQAETSADDLSRSIADAQGELPLAETFPLETERETETGNLSEAITEPPVVTDVAQPDLPTPAPVVAADAATPQEPVLIEAVRLSSVSPVYPSRCQRRADGTERVTVMFDIDSRGRPVNQRVSQTSNSCFNGASLSAIDRWTFEPARRDGAPVPVYGQTTTFVYNLPE